jgi:mRNA interferase RelE/StbE
VYDLRIEKRILKELGRYRPKDFKQIARKIFSLSVDPRPPDSKKIGVGLRVDSGEYRILYTVDDSARVVTVLLVGSRNDDEVYKTARRMGLM